MPPQAAPPAAEDFTKAASRLFDDNDSDDTDTDPPPRRRHAEKPETEARPTVSATTALP